MKAFIEQAKVMSKGQITIPLEIRKLLNLKNGDKVSFIVENNSVVMVNSEFLALKLIQEELKGDADRLGIQSEEDINKLLKEDDE